MFFSLWLRKMIATTRPIRHDRQQRFRPAIETLERRDVPAPLSSNPFGGFDWNGTMYFTADDGIHGGELWKTDGTPTGTVLVKDINAGTGFSNPFGFTELNGTLYFTANDGVNGLELWKTDGTAAGTSLVKDVWPGAGSSVPNSLINVNGMLYFTAGHPDLGTELWKSDGTAAGTVLVKDINPATFSVAGPTFLAVVNGTMFFTADDGIHGRELWKSDGTAAGTVLVKDIRPDSDPSSFFAPFVGQTVLNGTLFFAADDGVHGRELWKSDGTEAGTVLVKDINSTSGSLNSNDFKVVNGSLFFTADDGVHGRELWKSDGTEAGTVLVKDIVAGSVGSGPSFVSLTEVNGTLFFLADDGVHGRELWKSDGTEAGTAMVKDITPGSAGSNFFLPMANVNGTLFFGAGDGIHGVELWTSDGTEAGTVMVKDILPGSGSGVPVSFLTNVNGTVFFRADDGIHGTELWKSDGTESGTRMVRDINPTGTLPSLTLRSEFAQTTETVPVRIDVLANDWFAPGVTGTITAVSAPAHGSAVLNTDGTITYTSVAGYSGDDAFTYTVTDTLGEFDTATAKVQVYPRDFAKDDYAQTSQETAVTINVLANDVPTPGATITAVSVPTGGNAALRADGTITYTPNPGYYGNDSFTYTVRNTAGGLDTATVTVRVAQRVQIDIKPGDSTNAISLNNDGTISVTVFSTGTFDATTIDVGTVLFAGASVYKWSLQDVNHDGELDMMVQFRIDDTNLREVYSQLILGDAIDGTLNTTRQTTNLLLSGRTTGGTLWEGLDSATLFMTGQKLEDLLTTLGLK